MLETPDAVLEALRANDARPYGRERTVTAEELVEAAEQFDDDELLVTALHELLEAYEYDAEQRKKPVVFARLLKLWDTRPDAFDNWARYQVFWRFKWIAAALLSVPEVPLDAVRRWHTEMHDRYRAADHDLQPYYAQRYQLAAHLGADPDDAFDLWATRRRSRLSDCPACEVRARALHHLRAGDDARALEAWQPVLEGEHGCTEEPYSSHAYALLPLLRQGRTDDARSSHLVGYRWARGRSSAAALIGLHLEFCALSGNQARGLEILAENRDLFDQHGDPLARLEFLTGAEVLLARLAEGGHGDLAVSGPPGSSWTVDPLLAQVRVQAGELAARFDARNGTGAVGERRRERLVQLPLLAEPLALGVRAATVPPAAAVPVRPPVGPVPEDFAGLVRRARELSEIAHPDADALWQLISERLAELSDADDGAVDPALGTLTQLRAEAAVHRALDAVEREDRDQARSELATAQALFEQSGRLGAALAARARACRLEADGEAGKPVDWTELDRLTSDIEALRLVDPSVEAMDYLAVLQSRALAAHGELTAGLPDPSPETVERFEAELAAYQRASLDHGFPHRVAATRCYRADAYARLDRFEEAEAEVGAALELLDDAERPWHTARPLGLLSQLKLRQGKVAEAVPLIHRTLAEAARWEDRSFPFGPTYAMLGHACEHTGDTAGAVRALSEAATRFDREQDATAAAETRLSLSDILRRTGRAADGVAVLETALMDADEGLDERLRAQIRLNLARGLAELHEHRDAAREYLRLADAVAGWEDQDTHTMVACEAAVTLAEAGSWEAAGTARQRALRSHGTAPRANQVVAMLVEFARLTMAAEGPDGLPAALDRLAEADTVREQGDADGTLVTPWHPTGAIHEGRARVYAMADHFEEALASAELAITAYETGGTQAEEARAEAVRLAALIEGTSLDRPAAALTRLAAAIPRCEQSGLPGAAQALAALRDRLQAG
jgi:tetratricopeptide (TPR) repeat protein